MGPRQSLNALISFFWSVASWGARRFSRRGVRVSARVMSIGNIQAGGAGKTPLVAYLARQGLERGLSVCILSRGYGGSWESHGGVIAPGQTLVDVQKSGDEPALLHHLVPGAWIGVGADRVRQYFEIERKVSQGGLRPIDWVILDDGFQNRQFVKDLNIVAVTSWSRLDRVFRDFGFALRSADLVVWTKGEKPPPSYGRPLVRVKMELSQAMDLPAARGEGLLLVTGLGDGAHALRTIQNAGYRIEKHLCFGDHANYTQAQIKSILAQAKAQGWRVALTGKDWVKWRALLSQSVELESIRVFEPEVHMGRQDQEQWERVIWGG